MKNVIRVIIFVSCCIIVTSCAKETKQPTVQVYKLYRLYSHNDTVKRVELLDATNRIVEQTFYSYLSDSVVRVEIKDYYGFVILKKYYFLNSRYKAHTCIDSSAQDAIISSYTYTYNANNLLEQISFTGSFYTSPFDSIIGTTRGHTKYTLQGGASVKEIFTQTIEGAENYSVEKNYIHTYSSVPSAGKILYAIEPFAKKNEPMLIRSTTFTQTQDGSLIRSGIFEYEYKFNADSSQIIAKRELYIPDKKAEPTIETIINFSYFTL